MSTQSPEEARLRVIGERLGVAAGGLKLKSLARGVTHETILVEESSRIVGVLRLVPPGGGLLPGLDPQAEADVLEHLGGGGVPVPEIVLRDPDGSQLGRPGILSRYVAGSAAATWEALREHGGPQCADHALEVLVALHRRAIVAEHSPGLDGSAVERLRGVSRLAASAGGHAPDELIAALAVLAAAPPAPGARAWTHGDYRPANLVVDGGRVVVVLDWEMAGWGDPARDLGIATMPAWGRWWPDEELLERYREGGGTPLAPVALRWWRCVGYAMVVSFLALRAASGWGRGPELGPFVDGLVGAQGEWEAAR